MSDVEKYDLDPGKTFKIAPTVKTNCFHILTENSLEAVRSIARTAISTMFSSHRLFYNKMVPD